MSWRSVICAVFLAGLSESAGATDPRIDAESCNQLRLEQIKFRQSGILDDMQRGPEWAKANLSAERLREVEHYILLDEQVKFGCRDAKLSAEALKAGDAANLLEINADADPNAPKAPPAAGQTDGAVAPDLPSFGPSTLPRSMDQDAKPVQKPKRAAKPKTLSPEQVKPDRQAESQPERPAKPSKSKTSNPAPANPVNDAYSPPQPAPSSVNSQAPVTPQGMSAPAPALGP